MPSETWHKGYKEVKNVIHNEMGITKKEILEIFRQVAKEEAEKIFSEKHSALYEIVREVVRQELVRAVQDHRYPKVSRNIWNYTDKHSFDDFVAGVLKEEIIEMFRGEFQVNFEIKSAKNNDQAQM